MIAMSQDYCRYMNQQLERLLVFEGVFKEYQRTVANIERGNCLASENLAALKDALCKNVLRFNRFVAECARHNVPENVQPVHQDVVAGMMIVSHGLEKVVAAINAVSVDHFYYEKGLSQHDAGLAHVNNAVSHFSQVFA